MISQAFSLLKDQRVLPYLTFTLSLPIVILLLLIPITAANAASYRVAFISPGYEEQGFWHSVTEKMSVAAQQLDFDLSVYYSERQWVKMVRNAEQVISQSDKPDFLILVNEHQQGARLLALADKAGIPTLMLLNDLTPAQKEVYGMPRGQLKNWLGSLTPNNEVAGYEMAQSLVKYMNVELGAKRRSISLLTLTGDDNSPASLQRIKGLERALIDFPQLRELRRISVHWSKEEAYKRTRLWLQSGENLDVIWAANDAIALGAIKAIKDVGLKPGEDVMVAGLNWSNEAVKHVADGDMTLTHGGHVFAGAWAMVMLYDYVQGNDFNRVSTEINFPMMAINTDNAASYLSHLGQQKWSQIQFKQLSLTHSPQLTAYPFTLDKLLQLVSNDE